MLIKVLAYFIPLAINFLNGGFFFITSYRFAQAGCPGVVVGGALATWGVVYCAVSILIGRIARKSNILPLIFTGSLLLVVSAAGFMIFDGLYTQFLWLVVSGCGGASFCTPFQLLAKEIESGNGASGAVSATAFYTMTWSIGFATGPLAFAGLSVRQGFAVTLLLALAVNLSVTGIVLLTRDRRRDAGTAPAEALPQRTVPAGTRFSTASFTKLALLGWLVGGMGSITICQVRSMWPKLGSELAVPQHHVAYILALVSYVQAVTALSLCRSREWMWRRIPAVLVALCGIAALLLFAFGKTIGSFYAAAAIYGVYSGCFFFHLVYHSLAHPERSAFFVSGNEVIVGVTSLLFPLLGGWLADRFGGAPAAFIFGAAVTLIALIGQLIILGTIPEEEKVLREENPSA